MLEEDSWTNVNLSNMNGVLTMISAGPFRATNTASNRNCKDPQRYDFVMFWGWVVAARIPWQICLGDDYSCDLYILGLQKGCQDHDTGLNNCGLSVLFLDANPLGILPHTPD